MIGRPGRRRAPGHGGGPHALLVAALAAGLACAEQPELTLPSAADLEGLYGRGAQVELNGNVVDVSARQDADQLRRGGPLWAKVGPYIYLFSPQTKELLETYTGLGGVRATTYDRGGNLVAQALLERGELNALTWPKALDLVAKARLEGTRRPSYMIDLVEYGEEHARYEYSSRYVPEE